MLGENAEGQVDALDLSNLDLESLGKVIPYELARNLRVLNLRLNLFTEIELPRFVNLLKLDLSSNNIEDVGSQDMWVCFPYLKLLYLHDNILDGWDTLVNLTVIPRI